MVVGRRRALVFLSGTRISISRSLSASRCRCSVGIGASAWEHAAILVLLRQPRRLLSVCTPVWNHLAGRASKFSACIPAGIGSISSRSPSTHIGADTDRPTILVLLHQSSGLLPHGSRVPSWLATGTSECAARSSALVSQNLNTLVRRLRWKLSECF